MRHNWYTLALSVGVFIVGCTSSKEATPGLRGAVAKQISLAEEAYDVGRFGAAASRYRQALISARSQDDPSLIAPILHNLGTALQKSNLCSDAIVVFQEAFDLYRVSEQSKPMLMAQLGRASCEHALGLAEASTTLHEVQLKAEKLRENVIAAQAASGRAAIALAADAPESDSLVAVALEYAKASGNPSALGVASFNQGRLHEKNDAIQSAIVAFRQAAEAYRTIGDYAGLASALGRHAVLNAKVGGPPLETANLFQRAAHASASARNLSYASTHFSNAAFYFQEAGRHERAQLCREQAESLRSSSEPTGTYRSTTK